MGAGRGGIRGRRPKSRANVVVRLSVSDLAHQGVQLPHQSRELFDAISHGVF